MKYNAIGYLNDNTFEYISKTGNKLFSMNNVYIFTSLLNHKTNNCIVIISITLTMCLVS